MVTCTCKFWQSKTFISFSKHVKNVYFTGKIKHFNAAYFCIVSILYVITAIRYLQCDICYGQWLSFGWLWTSELHCIHILVPSAMIIITIVTVVIGSDCQANNTAVWRTWKHRHVTQASCLVAKAYRTGAGGRETHSVYRTAQEQLQWCIVLETKRRLEAKNEVQSLHLSVEKVLKIFRLFATYYL